MFSKNAIEVRQLSKCYHIYEHPRDRLKQFVVPRAQRLLRRQSRNYYREFWALKDVSFDVHKGETVGIVGRNGAGKSTLLQLICGTLNPSSGELSTRGTLAALLELGAGFNPAFTGRENVYLNGAILGLTVGEIDAKFEEIAAFAEIGDFLDQPVRVYSSGMYVRLAFAVQVCLDPDILVVDEALAVGDAYFVHRCFHRIREMKARGKTILFVSHDTASIKNLCDRAIWLDGGKLRMDGSPDEVTTQYLASLFNVKIESRKDGEDVAPGARSNSAPRLQLTAPEQIIPNVDRRLGERRCQILGLGLYADGGLQPIVEVSSGGSFLLRLSLINDSLAAGTPLVLGYALRSPRGEEIGGVNTAMEGIHIAAPEIGETMTTRTRISLPLLQRGSYALTVAIAVDDAGITLPEDRIENALVFTITETLPVVGLMRFPSEFSIETSDGVRMVEPADFASE